MNNNIRRRQHRHVGSATAHSIPFRIPCLPCKSPMVGTHDGRCRERSGSRGRPQRDCAADEDVASIPPSSRANSKNSARTHQVRSYDNQTIHMAASPSQHGSPCDYLGKGGQQNRLRISYFWTHLFVVCVTRHYML